MLAKGCSRMLLDLTLGCTCHWVLLGRKESVIRMAPKPDTAVLVSVVVPTCNRPDLLNRCLQALMAQSFDPSQFEVIVIDDAGEESTYRLVKEWSRQAEAYALLSGYELRLSQPAPLDQGELTEQTLQLKSSIVRVPG